MLPVCLFEDREECALGVKLLVLSARKHEPSWFFHIFARNLQQKDLTWLENQPNVKLRTEVPTSQKGWSVKPFLLRQLLVETNGPILWCDSDIILASPIMGILSSLPDTAFVATEEYGWGRQKGSKLRTAGWKLEEARPLSTTVNSSFMKMNTSHLLLLESWMAALSSPVYVEAQSRSWDQRALHLMSDQDALTALLASRDYAHIPLFLLKSGVDIAQCFEEDGYTVQDRLRNTLLGRVPPLIHAQGGKPWKDGARAIYQQLSPYNPIACPYLKDEILPLEWIYADTKIAKMFDWFAFRNPNLRGLLPAMRRTLFRVWKHRPRLHSIKKYILAIGKQF